MQNTIELLPVDHHQPAPAFVLPDSKDLPPHQSGQVHPPPSEPAWDSERSDASKLTKLGTWTLLLQLFGINFISSFSNGLLTIALPIVQEKLDIPHSLLLWPSSVVYLTSGSCLLIAGPVADVLGPRKVNLLGAFTLALFMLVCGFAQTSIQLIMFRALQGIATALCLPTAVSMVSTNIPQGRPRNIGFASIFLSMPLGFAIGLVLGGVLVTRFGWRSGFFVGGIVGFALFALGTWTLPSDPKLQGIKHTLQRLATELDWLGATMASVSVALFSYVLAMLAADTSRLKTPSTMVPLILAVLLLPAFACWMDFRTRRHKPALIPNAIWRNHAFTAICLLIFFANGVINSMELFCSLWFQNVQKLSAIDASIRLLPSVIVAAALNFLSGVFVNKTPILAAVLSTSAIGSVAPLLMALIDPASSYWYGAFWAQLACPLAVDILWTVGTLIVSSAFPTKDQALAGAVFNTFAQLGSLVALCVMQVVSNTVTADSERTDKTDPVALNQGYRAAFWAMFAMMGATLCIAAFGLRKVGRVGVKQD